MVLSNERLNALRMLLNTISPNAWWDADERERLLNEFQGGNPDELRATIRALPTSINGPQKHRYNDMTSDLKSWLTFLPTLYVTSIGCIGYCMGGTLTFQLATEPDVNLEAGVVFYGNAPASEAMVNIGCPILGLYGRNDIATTEKVPQVAK